MRIILLISMLAIFACKPKQTTPDSAATTVAREPSAEFMEFYKKFHQDSVFQMEHIVWPLEGNTVKETDSLKMVRIPIKFEATEWKMHKPLELAGSDYVREWSFFSDSDDMFEETIKYSAANFGMRRRWAKIAGEWHLIFYSDMQEI
jgi:hypothetical protein